MNPAIYQHDFVVPWHQIDRNGRLSMKAFEDYLQQAATQHAEDLGFGYDYLNSHQALWVLVAVKGVFYSHPQWLDDLSLRTWHRGCKGVISLRDFALYTKSGHLVATASSEWVIINHQTRAMISPSILDPYNDTIVEDAAMEPFTLKRNVPTEVQSAGYTVVFSDLDFNGHTNNSRYFEWISNVFEPLNSQHKAIKRFDIKFHSECFLGEHINMLYSFVQNNFTIIGKRKEDDKKVFTAVYELED